MQNLEKPLIIFFKPGCPYCMRTVKKIEDLSLPLEYKNIFDEGVTEELIKRGGKRQMPYLVDENTGVEMYESTDIIDYLEKTYGEKTTST